MGVIVYECLAGCRLHSSRAALKDVFERAQGLEPYPWELPLQDLPPGWSKARTRGVFDRCVLRDPAARPSAAQLLTSLNRHNNITLQPQS
jgi:hypothetical protein